uniref:Mitochondrial import inner membrane translocase subunit n=1 Tax=Aegilops tauschii subsp. strangulata TaxID=200361 RepID=A0A452XMX7_AEGTS
RRRRRRRRQRGGGPGPPGRHHRQPQGPSRRIRLYTWLSHRCFSDCVTTFYRKTLGKREGDCVRACVRKYQLATAASAARFNKLADPSAAADDEDED